MWSVKNGYESKSCTDIRRCTGSSQLLKTVFSWPFQNPHLSTWEWACLRSTSWSLFNTEGHLLEFVGDAKVVTAVVNALMSKTVSSGQPWIPKSIMLMNDRAANPRCFRGTHGSSWKTLWRWLGWRMSQWGMTYLEMVLSLFTKGLGGLAEVLWEFGSLILLYGRLTIQGLVLRSGQLPLPKPWGNGKGFWEGIWISTWDLLEGRGKGKSTELLAKLKQRMWQQELPLSCHGEVVCHLDLGLKLAVVSQGKEIQNHHLDHLGSIQHEGCIWQASASAVGGPAANFWAQTVKWNKSCTDNEMLRLVILLKSLHRGDVKTLEGHGTCML